jgi:hypothetical protein
MSRAHEAGRHDMSVMFEVYYQSPPDAEREARITSLARKKGGRLDCREGPLDTEVGTICLTYEFDERGAAEATASLLRQQGEYIEGPMEYAG